MFGGIFPVISINTREGKLDVCSIPATAGVTIAAVPSYLIYRSSINEINQKMQTL
jgi:hypothetical protein